MSNAEWYYAEDGQQKGPVAHQELQRLVARRRIQSDDLVWCEGMDDWLPAAQVPGLIAEKKKPKPVRKKESKSEAPAADKLEKPRDAAARATEPTHASLSASEKRNASAARRATQKDATVADGRPDDHANDAQPDDEGEFNPFLAAAQSSSDDAGEDDWPNSNSLEDAEGSPDEVDSDLALRPRFPTRRPRREPVREIIREVTHEVVFAEPLAHFSAANLWLQIILWALAGLIVIGAAIICGLRWSAGDGPNNAPMSLMAVSAAAFVLARSGQRCLELIGELGRR